jgi:hypothetical protein
MEGGSREATLFCAATLHRYGLPVDYARMKTETLLESCACCKAPLWDPAIPGTRMDKRFAWQSHLGRCGGDGRRPPTHEVVKRALMELVLSNPNPGGAAFPASSILINPSHLRRDNQDLGTSTLVTRETLKRPFKRLNCHFRALKRSRIKCLQETLK